MGYVGSYIWKMRQKIDDDEMMSATTDVMAIRDGKVCMVFNKDCQAWCFPGGHAELGTYWQSAARKELFEEAGITTEDEDLTPIASLSGYKIVYAEHYPVWTFSIAFICEKFEEQDFEDVEEIAEKRWFDFAEIDGLKKSLYATAIWEAYKKYVETGKFQQVVFRGEEFKLQKD